MLKALAAQSGAQYGWRYANMEFLECFISLLGCVRGNTAKLKLCSDHSASIQNTEVGCASPAIKELYVDKLV